MKLTHTLMSICFLAGCGSGAFDEAALSGAATLTAQTIAEGSAAPTRDDNMALGNPSDATSTPATPDNFLITRTQYALSFNNSRGVANWVSWHLSSAWRGTAPRSRSFTIDNTLPSGFVQVASDWYTGSGFDRGHICPSEDRDGSATDNQATFVMTNIQPQAPVNNQETWKALEDYARTLVDEGNELYIIAGGAGTGGTGSEGRASSLHDGDVAVPKYVWKIIVVLPVGSNDLSRISSRTRVIAVKMPNSQTVNARSWGYYRTSVDELEALTGYDFLSKVPAAVERVIEAAVDTGPES